MRAEIARDTCSRVVHRQPVVARCTSRRGTILRSSPSHVGGSDLSPHPPHTPPPPRPTRRFVSDHLPTTGAPFFHSHPPFVFFFSYFFVIFPPSCVSRTCKQRNARERSRFDSSFERRSGSTWRMRFARQFAAVCGGPEPRRPPPRRRRLHHVHRTIHKPLTAFEPPAHALDRHLNLQRDGKNACRRRNVTLLARPREG